MRPAAPRPNPPARRRFALLGAGLALCASLAACAPSAVRALNAEAAANGTAGPPNNGMGGRSGN